MSDQNEIVASANILRGGANMTAGSSSEPAKMDNPMDEAFLNAFVRLYPGGESLTFNDEERLAFETAFYAGASAAVRLIIQDPLRGRDDVVASCLAHAGRLAKSISNQR